MNEARELRSTHDDAEPPLEAGGPILQVTRLDFVDHPHSVSIYGTMLNFYDMGAWTRVVYSGIASGLMQEILELHSYLVVPVPEGDAHPWASHDGMVHYLQRDEHSFYMPRGFTPDVLLRLAKRGIQTTYTPDPRQVEDFNDAGWQGLYAKLQNDPQRWACDEMVAHREGISKLFTRFGKSYVTAVAWVRYGRPRTAIIVPRAAIIQQGVQEMSAFLQERVGWICSDLGDPVFSSKLTYVSLPSLIDEYNGTHYIRPQYQEFVNRLEAVWFDECHIAGGQMWAFNMASGNRLIQRATSATPFVKDAIKDMNLIGFTGPVRAEMSARQGADLGMISSMVVRWYRVNFSYELMYADSTTRAMQMQNYYSQFVVNNKSLNEAIAHIASYHVNAGDPVVIFVERVAHGRAIAALIPGCVANVGDVGSSDKDRFKVDFNDGKIKCVVTTKRWREGVTLKTHVVINAEGMKSDHVQEQRAGRGMMPKHDGRPLILYEFDFNDSPRYMLSKWSNARRRFYHEAGWEQSNVGTIDVKELTYGLGS